MGVIVSKFDGRCRQCGHQIKVGESVYWTQGVKGVICLDCVANGMTPGGTPNPPPAAPTWQTVQRAGNSFWRSQSPVGPPPPITFKGIPLFSTAAGRTASQINAYLNQPPPPPPKPAVVSPTQLALVALAALEALIMELATAQMTPEMDEAWKKYQKIKQLALNPGTKGEERAALKQALIHAVKLAF